MAMNPLGALQLADNRKQAAWEQFTKGIDDVGNLDTYMKDRNLTTGDVRPGVFGGNGWKIWKMWTPEGAREADLQNRQGKPRTPEEIRASTEALQQYSRQPELADVHRWAKLRGLNHDQGSIDEKTQRPAMELEQQKHIGSTLKQEQANLDTRLAGVRNSISNLYTALSQETDPETKKAMQKQIATLESEKNIIAQDMGNVVNLMDGHGIPDFYYRRQERGAAAPAEPNAGEITDADTQAIDAFVNSVNPDSNTHYSQSQVRALLDKAGLGNLKPHAKHVSGLLEDKQKFLIGRDDAALEKKKAGQALTKGAGGIQEDNAVRAQKIEDAKGQIAELSKFIDNPDFKNYGLVMDKLGKGLPAEQRNSLVSKIPTIGPLLDSMVSDNASVTEQSFKNNQQNYVSKAQNIRNGLKAYLEVLEPQKKQAANARDM